MSGPRRSGALNPLGSDFDRFLYEQVGADRHGGLLSVISALARLGVDPWEQAAILARLPVDGAVRALAALLARLPAGTGEPVDPIPVATHLVTLLPRAPQRAEPDAAFADQGNVRTVTSLWFKALLGVVFLLLLLGVQRLLEH